jgi:hypothetical protein
MLFGEIELTPMGGAAAAPRISSGGAPADADQHVAASMLLCEPAGGTPAGADQHVAARMLLDEPAGGALAGADQHVDINATSPLLSLRHHVPIWRQRIKISYSSEEEASSDGEEKLTPRRSLLARSARGASDGEEKKLTPLRALLKHTARGGLPPLPIERVVERPPHTVRDLLPRGAPLERDGTWLMPDNWPHFLDGAHGAALMTSDPDDLTPVSEDALIFVRTCIKCSKSVDTRCEPCSGDAYRKQVDVFCNACLHAECGPILESCTACNALSVPASPAKQCAHGVRIKDSICLLCERAGGAMPEARRKQKRNFKCFKCKVRDVDASSATYSMLSRIYTLLCMVRMWVWVWV